MKTTLIPNKEYELINKVIEATGDLVTFHSGTQLDKDRLEMSTDLEQVHITMFIDLLGELVSAVGCMKEFLEVSEEEYLKMITKNGERSLKELKMLMMLKMINDIEG